MWIDDADRQAKWYQALKREWSNSRRARRRSSIRWRPRPCGGRVEAAPGDRDARPRPRRGGQGPGAGRTVGAEPGSCLRQSIGRAVPARARRPPPFEVWWSHLDPGHTGRADRAAFRADAVAFFQRLDVNHDGVVDGFEVAAYEKTIAPELAADGQGLGLRGASRDGPVVQILADPEPVSGADLELTSRITLAEWLAATDRRFDLLDKKKQGFLDHDAMMSLLPQTARSRR